MRGLMRGGSRPGSCRTCIALFRPFHSGEWGMERAGLPILSPLGLSRLRDVGCGDRSEHDSSGGRGGGNV